MEASIYRAAADSWLAGFPDLGDEEIGLGVRCWNEGKRE